MDKDKALRLCDRSHSARHHKLPIIGTSGDSDNFQILSHERHSTGAFSFKSF